MTHCRNDSVITIAGQAHGVDCRQLQRQISSQLHSLPPSQQATQLAPLLHFPLSTSHPCPLQALASQLLAR